MRGAFYYKDEAYAVIEASPEKNFVRYILQKVGDNSKNYLIISERVNNENH